MNFIDDDNFVNISDINIIFGSIRSNLIKINKVSPLIDIVDPLIEKTDEDKVIERSEITEFLSLDSFDKILHNILNNTKTINIQPQDMLKDVKLIDSYHSFIEDKYLEYIKESQIEGISGCMLCLLTNNWTLAGMAAIRVANSALLSYYQKIYGEAPKNNNDLWNKVIQHLSKEEDRHKYLINYLHFLKKIKDALGDVFRSLTSREADTTFIYTIQILRNQEIILPKEKKD